jgi:hypothetical protein
MTISTEQFISINTGIIANDGRGDTLRAAFIKVNENFANISDVGFDSGNINVRGSIEVAEDVIVGGKLTVNNVYVPTANTDPGTAGQITWDGDYVYICVADNDWKRANLAAW